MEKYETNTLQHIHHPQFSHGSTVREKKNNRDLKRGKSEKKKKDGRIWDHFFHSALKTQLVLLAILLVALVNFIVGSAMGPKSEVQIERGFLGYQSKSVDENSSVS